MKIKRFTHRGCQVEVWSYPKWDRLTYGFVVIGPRHGSVSAYSVKESPCAVVKEIRTVVKLLLSRPERNHYEH